MVKTRSEGKNKRKKIEYEVPIQMELNSDSDFEQSVIKVKKQKKNNKGKSEKEKKILEDDSNASTYRCSLDAIFKALKVLKNKEDVMSTVNKRMKKTPFWPFFSAIFDGQVKQNEHKKCQINVDEIVKCYSFEQKSFIINEWAGKVSPSDISIIYGLPLYGRNIFPIRRAEKPNPESKIFKFVMRHFGDVSVIRRSTVDDAIEIAAKSDDEDMKNDLASLLILLLFGTYFFPNSQGSIPLGYIRYAVLLKEMKSVSWPSTIVASLEFNLKKYMNNPRSMPACVMALMYWYCEHMDVLKRREIDMNRYPRFASWNLQDLKSVFTKEELGENKRKKVVDCLVLSEKERKLVEVVVEKVNEIKRNEKKEEELKEKIEKYNMDLEIAVLRKEKEMLKEEIEVKNNKLARQSVEIDRLKKQIGDLINAGKDSKKADAKNDGKGGNEVNDKERGDGGSDCVRGDEEIDGEREDTESAGERKVDFNNKQIVLYQTTAVTVDETFKTGVEQFDEGENVIVEGKKIGTTVEGYRKKNSPSSIVKRIKKEKRGRKTDDVYEYDFGKKAKKVKNDQIVLEIEEGDDKKNEVRSFKYGLDKCDALSFLSMEEQNLIKTFWSVGDSSQKAFQDDTDIVIFGSAIEELLFGDYIDGEVIDFCMKKLQRRYKNQMFVKTTVGHALHLGIQCIINQFKKQVEDFVRKPEADQIFFPLCENKHWTLLAFSIKERKWTLYNSSRPRIPKKGSCNIRAVNQVKNLVWDILAKPLLEKFRCKVRKEDKTKIEICQDCAQQGPYSVDCAIFVYENMRELAENNKPKTDVSDIDFAEVRAHLAHEILADKDFSWSLNTAVGECLVDFCQ